MYESRYRQFQLAVKDVLLGHGERVGLDQGEAEPGHVVVLHAFTVDGVESDPGADLRLPVTDRSPDIVRVLLQRGDQFRGRAVIDALARQPLMFLLV